MHDVRLFTGKINSGEGGAHGRARRWAWTGTSALASAQHRNTTPDSRAPVPCRQAQIHRRAHPSPHQPVGAQPPHPPRPTTDAERRAPPIAHTLGARLARARTQIWYTACTGARTRAETVGYDSGVETRPVAQINGHMSSSRLSNTRSRRRENDITRVKAAPPGTRDARRAAPRAQERATQRQRATPTAASRPQLEPHLFPVCLRTVRHRSLETSL